MTKTIARIDEELLNGVANVIKCLGHPLRLRLLEALEGGEKTVSELQEYAGASQSAVSQQLGTLRGRGVVEGRREGLFVVYRLTERRVSTILQCVRELASERNTPGY